MKQKPVRQPDITVSLETFCDPAGDRTVIASSPSDLLYRMVFVIRVDCQRRGPSSHCTAFWHASFVPNHVEAGEKRNAEYFGSYKTDPKEKTSTLVE
jgi:hypothetical protein